MKRLRIWHCGVLFVTLALGWGCDSGEKEARPDTKVAAIPVETMIVTERPFVDRVDVSGVVRPLNEVRVAAEAPGRVLSAPFEEGERVKRGKLLLRVDSQVDSARIDVLKNQVSTAEREFERTKTLAKQGLATPQQLDQAASAVDQARLSLEQIRVAVGKSTVRSPISGYIAVKSVEKGEYVGPGQQLAHIVQYDTVKIEASVPESDIRFITEEKEVEIYLPALEKSFSGKVKQRAIVASERTRTFPVEIHVPNPGRQILPGMRARVIVPRKDYGNVVVVPRDAILKGFDREEAMVLESDEDEGEAMVHVVEVGPSAGSDVVVLDGLEKGERLIVKGHRGLAEGTRVRVVSQTETEGRGGQAPEAAKAEGDEEPVNEEVAEK